MLKHSQKFKEIKDSYVIFITEHDVFHANLPLYHIERTHIELKRPFGDGNHIIYANAEYEDDNSDIGKLLHDFRCRNVDDMYYSLLKEGVRHFKESQGGKETMSSDIEKYGEEKAIEATVDFARDAKMSDKQIEDYLTRKYKLSKEDIAKYLSPAYA